MRGNRKNIWRPTWKPTLGENIIKMVSFLDEDGKIQFFSTYKAHYLDAAGMIVCPKTWVVLPLYFLLDIFVPKSLNFSITLAIASPSSLKL